VKENKNQADGNVSEFPLAWMLLLGLLCLRILLLAGARVVWEPAVPEWVLPTYEVGTYALVAVFIWFERERLAAYHIDRLALAILVVGKPIELLMCRLHIPFTWPEQSKLYLLNLPVAIGLTIVLVGTGLRVPKVRARDWLWAVVGIVAGGMFGAFIGHVVRAQVGHSGSQMLTRNIAIFLPLQQMIHAGLPEEPVFRGILWGLLRRAGVKEVRIWLFQGMLFWVAHLYYLDKFPLSFWVVVPLSGLLFGLLAWGSRSITTSMFAHGMVNGVGQIVAFYRF
jgi:hypothetical protein